MKMPNIQIHTDKKANLITYGGLLIAFFALFLVVSVSANVSIADMRARSVNVAKRAANSGSGQS